MDYRSLSSIAVRNHANFCRAGDVPAGDKASALIGASLVHVQQRRCDEKRKGTVEREL